MEPKLITKAHQNNVKVLVSIGGAGQSENFPTIAASSTLRQRFAANVYKFIRDNNYDGVDLDWEFPQSSTQRTQLNSLVNSLRNKFDSSPAPAPTWQISMAIPSTNYYGQWLDYTYLQSRVSFLNLMTYDFHGSWYTHSGHNSPLYEGNDPVNDWSFSDSIAYMINDRDFPKSKLNAGVPFYGYNFINSETVYDSCSGSCQTTYLPFQDIVLLIDNGWTKYYDSASEVPYLRKNSGTGMITYDDASSITLKVDYALDDMGLGGVFMWDLSQDRRPSGTQPLLNAMYSAKNT